MIVESKDATPPAGAMHDNIDPRALAFPAERPSRRRRWMVWGVGIGALGIASFTLYPHLVGGEEARVLFREKRAVRTDLEKQISATGTLSALVTVTVGSQVSGRIQELLVDYNARVKKGQVIARIDPRLYRTDVDRARANLSAARANVLKSQAAAEEARLQYERDKLLAQKKVVATAEVQTRLATYTSARAQVAASRAGVAQAKAALTQTRTNLAYTTIVSPIDGVVVSRSVEVGQTVAASLQAPTLFTIAEDLRQMEVHTSVAESDVGQLKKGMATRFSVDAFPSESFEGVVKQVRFEAQTVQNVVTYDAVIKVNNQALKLRPGMTANVTFIIATREDVLTVPNASLRFRPPAGATAGRQVRRDNAAERGARGLRGGRTKVIWVLRRASAGAPALARVVIETGLSDGSATEVTKILEGRLEPGDAVIVGVASSATAKSHGATKKRGGRRGPPRIL